MTRDMTEETLFSIRMRASSFGRHISGAERIARFDAIEAVLLEMLSRIHGRKSAPDSIVFSIDRIDVNEIVFLKALDMRVVNAPDLKSCRHIAKTALLSLGVSQTAVSHAFELLTNGAAASGGNMRGAVIMDAESGERLEPDKDRGVRATRFDWSVEGRRKADELLRRAGLTHFRTAEALALATKVAHAPDITAELCWSDEPDYTAGYVASLKTGYIRLPFMKEAGSLNGGRVFFVKGGPLDIEKLIRYLERTPALITDAGSFRYESYGDVSTAP